MKQQRAQKKTYVREAEESSRDDGDQILLVVDTMEVRDFGVEECSVVGVSNSGRSVGDTLDSDVAREVQGEEQRVQFT